MDTTTVVILAKTHAEYLAYLASTGRQGRYLYRIADLFNLKPGSHITIVLTGEYWRSAAWNAVQVRNLENAGVKVEYGINTERRRTQ